MCDAVLCKQPARAHRLLFSWRGDAASRARAGRPFPVRELFGRRPHALRLAAQLQLDLCPGLWN
eukprot:10964972-Alexandrium_andersonii.AAC.1